MKYEHIPVMLNEVLEYLQPQAGQSFIDCTLGGGGYTFALAARVGPQGAIISIDLDSMAIANAEDKIKAEQINNVVLVKDNFSNLHKIIHQYYRQGQERQFSGIVFDLGLSSAQLKDRSRGFSFQSDAPVDMSFGEIAEETRSTAEMLNSYRQEELENIIKTYGEEKFASRIAQGIVSARKNSQIKTTKELVQIIRDAIPSSYANNKKIHFATRTFQAIRIATNNELANLQNALPQAMSALKPGGRLAVISYHSLEDRIVKEFFRQESKDCICPPIMPVCQCQHQASLKILTKKIITPTEAEIKNNPRARSAKMRVAQKI